MSACNNVLRNAGKPYPRTCAKCRLGPCIDEEADTIAALRAELAAVLAREAEAYRRHDAKLDAAEAEVARLTAERDRMREALTPSGDTKSAYSGEFHISVYGAEDENGNEIWRNVPVDWPTIKAIMATIKARALAAPAKGGE